MKNVKKRIKSVQNISQITKAMEVVSATKMRKSQEFALKARPFAAASLEMLLNLLNRTKQLPPLLKKRKIKNYCLIVVVSDKGLVGAFNSNILKIAEKWIADKTKSNDNFYLITVGKKAKDYFERRNYKVFKNFTNFGDFTELKDTLPISELIIEGFLHKQWDQVEACYTHFKTTLIQQASLVQILPVTKSAIEAAVKAILPEYGKYANLKDDYYPNYQYEYIFEPSPEEIFNTLVPQLLKMHLHHIILESNASEHSARMVTMKNASDNAKELMDELRLTYNKARQAAITKELIEITSGI